MGLINRILKTFGYCTEKEWKSTETFIENCKLRKQLQVHHLYLKSLNARADVENYLLRAAAGKESLPTKEKCLALAQKLGLEPEFMEAHGINPDRVLKQL